MRYFITTLMILGFIFGCAHTPKEIDQLYTAYNIWAYRNPDDMRCINFKSSHHIIRAGTPVSDVKFLRSKSRRPDKIIFKAEGNEVIINFYKKYHPGKNVESYKNLMFSTNTFDQLTQGMSKSEILAVKRGELVEGMSKRATIVSYGYPPEHETYNLEDNVWIYWMHKFKRKKICFDDNEKTVRCNRMKRQRKNTTL